MSAQWNGAETGSGTARLAPAALHFSDARATAAAWPAITTWPWRVHVGRGHDLPVRRLAARAFDRGEIEAENRGHRADTDRNGLLHVLAAAPHGPQRVLERERLGRDERRVLAEAVAGHALGPDASGHERPQRRGARRQDRRLRVRRELQLRLGPSKHSFESGKPSAASACA
jgi:hypothetical protein